MTRAGRALAPARAMRPGWTADGPVADHRWTCGRTRACRCPGVTVMALLPFNIPAGDTITSLEPNLAKFSADSCARLGGHPGSARWRPRRRRNGHHGA